MCTLENRSKMKRKKNSDVEHDKDMDEYRVIPEISEDVQVKNNKAPRKREYTDRAFQRRHTSKKYINSINKKYIKNFVRIAE